MRKNRHNILIAIILSLALSCDFGFAEETRVEHQPFTLKQAITTALKNYPSIRGAQAKVSASQSGVTLARTAYYPDLNLLAQLNRGTRNNITGVLLPQGVIPPISGPPIDDPSFGMAWGSAIGALFSWEPIDFGLRKANVNLAEAEVKRANANTQLTEFQVASAVADTYLKVLATKQAVKTAEANIERTQVFANTVQVLTKNGLRPGVDFSRANAELAFAKTQLARAREAEMIALAQLAQQMGLAGQRIDIQNSILQHLTESKEVTLSVKAHPLLTVQESNIEVIEARKKSLSRSYFPRFNIQVGAFGRGSGVDTDLSLERGANGLYPTHFNLVAGVTTTFSVLDLPEIKARLKQEEFNTEVEQARYDELVQEITGRVSQSQASYEAALEVARHTPVQLEAARLNELQIRSRYKAGLATVVDVADAQRLLTQAEIEDRLAQLGVWRALLQQSVVQGNLKPYLDLVNLQEGN